MTACALYARISQDDQGLEKGVQRQLEDARQLASQHGWTVAGEYVDNDVSAFNGAARKQYLHLMADAAAGRFQKIIVWHPSRLWRQRSERIRDIEILRRMEIGVSAVRGPELDLGNAYGRLIAGVLGEFDSMESDVKSERVARAALQRAQEGRPHSMVAYGWRRERTIDASGRIIAFQDVENPQEAAIVREIVDRLLTGEPLRSLVRDLNERRIPAPRGGLWNPTIVRQVAVRPANAALRRYKDRIIGEAAWPPLVPRDKYERLLALLNAPSRLTRRPGKRRHLLSYGIGECGVCGSPLSARMERRYEPGRWDYRCASPQSCVARRIDQVDELVGPSVIERLALLGPGIFDADDSVTNEAREKAQAIRARLDNAADQYAAGDIDGRQLSRITATLRPQLETAETELRRSRPAALPNAAEGLLTDKAAAVWATLPVTAKRTVLEIIGLNVVINKRQRHGPGFEDESIEIRWQK
jgi:site-specific DNA recombinase